MYRMIVALSPRSRVTDPPAQAQPASVGGDLGRPVVQLDVAQRGVQDMGAALLTRVRYWWAVELELKLDVDVGRLLVADALEIAVNLDADRREHEVARGLGGRRVHAVSSMSDIVRADYQTVDTFGRTL